jgi:hypothetical protein
MLRISFQNIGRFLTNRYKIKEDIIRHGITRWDFNVFGFAEMNIDWRLVEKDSRLPLQTKECWEHQHVS